MKNTNWSFSLNLSASSDPAAPWPLIIEHCKKMCSRASNNNRFYISSICDGRIWNTVKLGYQGKAKFRDLGSKKYAIKLSTSFFWAFLCLGTLLTTGEMTKVHKMQSLLLMNLHTKIISQFSCSVVSDSATPWTTARQASLSITNSWSLPKLMSIELVIAIQPSHPLSSPFSPSFNLSQHQGLFKWVSSSHQVAKVLEFQLQHQSFQWTLRTDHL